ncbi:MAG: hypothetical protein ACLP9K_04935 [Nitrososphaerales archaeon]
MSEKERIYDCLFIYGENNPYRPDVCERFRLCFQIPKHLIPGQYGFVKKVLEDHGGVREIGTWRVPYDQTLSVIAELETNNYIVETLVKSVNWLKEYMFNVGLRSELGEELYVKLPTLGGFDWQFLDPSSRSWGSLRIERSFEGNYCYVPAGSILRIMIADEEQCYLVGKDSKLLAMAKKAAIAIGSRTFKPRKITFSVQKEFMAMRKDEVGILPIDVFSLVARLRPTREHRDDIYFFFEKDRDVISELFSLVNLSLTEGSFRLGERRKHARRKGFSYKDDEKEFLRGRTWQ